ncbi:hypothetical protein BVX99_01960, partial [bacterium F16]
HQTVNYLNQQELPYTYEDGLFVVDDVSLAGICLDSIDEESRENDRTRVLIDETETSLFRPKTQISA